MVSSLIQSQLRYRHTGLHYHDGHIHGILSVFWRQTSCVDGYWSTNDVLRLILRCNGKRRC